ncbi:DNA-binding transcriptional MerR regulator [Mycobacterium sp. BK558]|nr:DNA-binding transcriptional MerR regulator [Mycobacterium sp. BK558]
MRISEVSARTGVPATTLRYYESIGLLTPGREGNGYRSYDESAVQRLDFVDAAKELGLELPEIHVLLNLADSGTCTAVRDALSPVLNEQLAKVQDGLARMNRLHDHLVAADRHVSACPDSTQPCRSDCAFIVLSQTRPPGSFETGPRERRRAHWQRLLRHAAVDVEGDTMVIELPVDSVIEVSALAAAEHAEHPATTFVGHLANGRYRVTICAPARDCAVFDAWGEQHTSAPPDTPRSARKLSPF